MAMEVLDTECMEVVGLVTEADAWKRKEIRFNTRVSYTVSKCVVCCSLFVQGCPTYFQLVCEPAVLFG